MVTKLNKCDIRLGYHTHNNTIRYYGSDESGEKEYSFNSLGYRCDEFNPKSKENIFIAGCSYTLGVGLNSEETWAYQFKKLLAEERKSKLDEVGLMNFSVGGASNDYIARILLSQSSLVKPDLIVAYFTHSYRTEYLDEEAIKMIGPWSVNLDFKGDKGTQLHLDDLEDEALSYYSYTTPELEFVNMVKNMVLLQSYCKSSHINWVFASIYKDDLFSESHLSNPVCSRLLALLDREHYCNSNIKIIDTAADNSHPGPKSNKAFAEKIFETYKNCR